MGNAAGSTSALRAHFLHEHHRDVWTRIVHALPSGASITAHKTIGMPLPLAPLPWRTVMVHMETCMLCLKESTICQQVYISHCVGWIVCSRCHPRALLGALFHRQHVSHTVSTHVLFPNDHCHSFAAKDKALRVQFFRKRTRAMQLGWLAPWLHLDVLCIAHGAATLVCHFSSTGNDTLTAPLCDVCRGVSVRNLVAHNPVIMLPVVSEIYAQLRTSDEYEADVRLKWTNMLRNEVIQGLALHKAFHHLHNTLFPEAIPRILSPLLFQC